MSSKFNFDLRSDDWQRKLPEKLIIGRSDLETDEHVVLKLLAYVLLFRERLELSPNLHNEDIPFIPGVVQLDYQLNPILWVECGECTVQKLDKLAVKVHEAEIWVMLRSPESMANLLRQMEHAKLRKKRYHLVAFEEEMFDEMLRLLHTRNQFYLVQAGFEPPTLQFDFNELWFDVPFYTAKF
ncbi:MAG TPA: YaeQ family protein [Verrucomicrobiae bacterium]